jgi:hypothetical protein
MTIYTAHAPPLRGSETAYDPARFKFIRDGFYFWAFVFGPLWLLFKRLWVVLVLYIVAVAVLNAALWLIGVPRATYGLVSLLVHLLVGLEAATLQRWTLGQNNWAQLGVVSGNNFETAERRFFDAWVAQKSRPTTPSDPSPPISSIMRAPPDNSDIIGLFPEPQSRQ